MDSIATTSLLTAAMRAVETKRTDAEGRLFSDPFAEVLAGPEGFELLERAIAASGPQPSIAIRTAFIDRGLVDAVAAGARQVVMLAAGMDTRAYRLPFPAGVTVYELDRPEVLAYKAERLAGAALTCERRSLAVDLREPWEALLAEAGFRAGERTIWLVEGLLMYLREEDVRGLLTRVNALATSGDTLFADILGSTLLRAPHMQSQLGFLASLGAPWLFGHDTPGAFLGEFGWDAAISQAADVAPARWPFPTAPLSVPNVPRGYFVRATKR